MAAATETEHEQTSDAPRAAAGLWARLVRVVRRLMPGASVLLVAVIGGWLGAALAPPTTTRVGPLTADVSVVPSAHPGIRVLLPPAGRVEFATHAAPVAVEARVREVDLDAARALLEEPAGLRGLEDTAPDELRRAAVRAAATTAGCMVAGAVVLGVLVYRRSWRRTAETAGILVGCMVATLGLGRLTFDADRFAAPQFTGLLSQAPYVTGSASSLVDRLESYRSGLADIVEGVTSLYAASGRLPVLESDDDADVITLLHVSDIHLNPLAFDLIDRLVAQFGVDAVLDTGDITTWGTEVEARTLSRVGQVKVPYVLVRGNHDSARTERAVAANANAHVLGNQVLEVAGVVIAGIGDPQFTPDRSELVATPSTSSPETSGQGAAQQSPPAVPALTPSQQLQRDTGEQLARTITGWNVTHPERPVQIALVHEPAATPPLLGRAPLVLAGHLHQRSVRIDGSGSIVMVEGSTGGAGITAGGFERLRQGQPVPLSASVLYLARRGPRAGQVVAYDEVSVGGFGAASVTVQRHVVRAPDVPPLRPPEVPGASSTPATTGG